MNSLAAERSYAPAKRAPPPLAAEASAPGRLGVATRGSRLAPRAVTATPRLTLDAPGRAALRPESSFAAKRKAAAAAPPAKRATGGAQTTLDALKHMTWEQMCAAEGCDVASLLAFKLPAAARFDAKAKMAAQEGHTLRLAAAVRSLEERVRGASTAAAVADAAAGGAVSSEAALRTQLAQATAAHTAAMRSAQQAAAQAAGDAAAAAKARDAAAAECAAARAEATRRGEEARRADADAATARAAAATAEASAAQLRSYNEQLQCYNGSLQSDVASLREELRAAAAERGAAAQEAGAARGAAQAANAAAAQAAESAAARERDRAAAVDEAARLAAALATAGAERDAAAAEAARAGAAADAARAGAERAAEALASAEARAQTAEAAASRAGADMARVSAERDAAAAEARTLGGELRCAREEAARASAEAAQARAAADAADEEAGRLRAALARARGERDGAAAEAARATADAAARAAEAACARDAAASAAGRAAAAEAEAARASAALDAATSCAAADKAALTAQLAAISAEVTTFREASTRSGDAAATAGARVAELGATVAAQEGALAALRAELAAAREAAQRDAAAVAAQRGSLSDALARAATAEAFAAAADAKLCAGEEARRKLHNALAELRGNIRVVCRARPPSADEAATDAADTQGAALSFPTADRELRGRGVELALLPTAAEAAAKSRCERERPISRYTFAFDAAFTPEASQEAVFSEVAPLVQSALDGYKACVFAYGPTGSGKTHTMLGATGDVDASELGEQAGMIPRALELLFRSREAAKAAGWRYTFRASMLEVYCEELLDLLAPGAAGLRGAQVADWDKAAASASGGARALEVRHDEASGVTVVEGATSVEVGSAQEVAELLQRAAAARATGRTACNARSSRSHLVMSLRLDGDNELTGASSRGALHLVDLAGSERLSRSGAAGDSLKETQAINKSLSALGDVIAALAAHAPHVPYRNSKLTWLLAGALGGDAKTLMLVNIAPGREAAPETLCSLRFAAKVNSVELATQKRCGELAGPGAAIAAKAAAAKKAAK